MKKKDYEQIISGLEKENQSLREIIGAVRHIRDEYVFKNQIQEIALAVVVKICDEMKFDISLLNKKCRQSEIVLTRHLVHQKLEMYLTRNGHCRLLPPSKCITLEEIGKITGKDHATILHSKMVIQNEKFANKKFNEFDIFLSEKIRQLIMSFLETNNNQ